MDVRMKGEEVIVSYRHDKRINMKVRIEGEEVIVSFGSDKRIKLEREEESKASPEHLVSFHHDRSVNVEVRADGEKSVVSFGRDNRIKMEGEEKIKALPEHVVEKIVSMVSFPYLFKFRGLSKAWLTRFLSIASRDDEARECLVTPFQKQVSDFSSSWGTFYPICIGKENSFAYDRVSHVWRRFPGLSFLPNSLRDRTDLQVEGTGAVLRLSCSKDELYIANILTRSWKRLPPCPSRGLIDTIYHKLVTLGTSTLILFLGVFLGEDATYFLNECNYGWAHVYDCKSDAWSVQRFVASREDTLQINDLFLCKNYPPQANQDAFLNGVLYVVPYGFDDDFVRVLAIDVEGGTLKLLELTNPIQYEVVYNVNIYLVVCNANLHFVVISSADPPNATYNGDETHQLNDEVMVFKIDLELLHDLKLATGPPADLNVGKIYAPPVSDGNCITFREKGNVDRLLEYNPVVDEWSLLTGPPLVSSMWDDMWLGSSFNPGLNPFGDV